MDAPALPMSAWTSCSQGKTIDAMAARVCLAYGHAWSGRLPTIGVEVLLTTTQRKGAESDGLISMCGRKAGTWMKSPAFALALYSPLAPQRTSHMPDKTYAIVCCSP